MIQKFIAYSEVVKKNFHKCESSQLAVPGPDHSEKIRCRKNAFLRSSEKGPLRGRALVRIKVQARFAFWLLKSVMMVRLTSSGWEIANRKVYAKA